MRRYKPALAVAAAVFSLAACGTTGHVEQKRPVAESEPYKPYLIGRSYRIKGRWYKPREDLAYDREGMASWYGRKFHGRRTANGETYNMNAFTAAHRTLPMPSILRVTNLSNGRSVVVRVNDRGPYARGRIIDLSRAAAKRIGMLRAGVARVRVQVMREESQYLRREARNGARTHILADRLVTRANRGDETLTAEQRGAKGKGRTVAENGGRNVPERVNVEVETASEAEGRDVQEEGRAAVEREPIYRETARRRAVNTERVENTEFRQETLQRVAATETRIFVQAGAFSEQANAEEVRARLAQIGDVRISPIRIRETVFYRVRVGPVVSAEEGDDLLARVVRSGYPNARIVVE